MSRGSARPVSISDVLAHVLAGRGMAGTGAVGRLGAHWAETVGASVASHAMPDSIKGGQLIVVVDSNAWMNQLTMLSTTLIGQINGLLGEGAVKDVRFRLGKVTGGKQGGRTSPPGPPKKAITQEERELVEDSLGPIHDEALKERARSMLLKSCTRKR